MWSKNKSKALTEEYFEIYWFLLKTFYTSQPFSSVLKPFLQYILHILLLHSLHSQMSHPFSSVLNPCSQSIAHIVSGQVTLATHSQICTFYIMWTISNAISWNWWADIKTIQLSKQSKEMWVKAKREIIKQSTYITTIAIFFKSMFTKHGAHHFRAFWRWFTVTTWTAIAVCEITVFTPFWALNCWTIAHTFTNLDLRMHCNCLKATKTKWKEKPQIDLYS